MEGVYITKVRPISGTQSAEVYKKAFDIYKQLRKKTKRRPYVRSVYFKKDKVFLETFWHHLHQKSWRERAKRTPYFTCGLDLIRNCTIDPESKDNPSDHSQIVHRFTGSILKGEFFRVQIKEDKRNGNKWLMSIYPVDADKILK